MSFETEKQKVRLKSGNQCAYPGCANKLSDTHQIAHIRSRKVDGPRHVPNWNNGNYDVEANLIALCPIHHNIIDKKENINAYPVEVLEKLKYAHENKVSDIMCDATLPDKDFMRKVFSVLKQYDIINNLKQSDPTAPIESQIIENLDYCQEDLNFLINQSFGIGITQKILEDWSNFTRMLDSYVKYLEPYIDYRPIDSNHGFFINLNPNETRQQITDYRQNLLNIIGKYI